MKWDLHVPASFEGAPPVCIQCRQVGHIKAECPRMTSIRCFQCQKRGHTARKCLNREQSYEKEIDSYIQARDGQKKKQNDGINAASPEKQKPVSKNTVQEQKKGEMDITAMTVEEEEDVGDKDMDMDKDPEEEDPTTNWESGLQASMHAPIETATHMKIDLPKELTGSPKVRTQKIESRKEMLAMSSTRPQKRRLPIAPRTLPEDIKKYVRSTTIIEEPVIIRVAAKDMPTTIPTTKIV
ncbi:hypothetical protein INT44_006459 [Umbelopsis vinacea]|uniref:CCHC-type domain-containing protein n=1 Tax=Umbelopsis vinacea TaxID=44442 RepID=A0A8H7PUU0_9FUNG|nr:hypothetical protein INT44_006459 [Umbelopsis vinacea]